MTSPSIKQNQIPNDPHLADLLDAHGKGLLLNLNCHHLATVQSFNSAKQTATATINYKKTFFEPDPVTSEYVPVLKDYPILVDAPVICLGGGAGALTFPITSGDECLVLFNDRDIDNWFQGNSGGAVATPRLHSFSDGLILVGVRSMANVLVSYDTDGVALRFKSGTDINKVIVKADRIIASTGSTMSLEIDATGKLKITNASAELVAALYQLFTDIQGATAGGFPLVMPTFALDLVKLASFKA